MLKKREEWKKAFRRILGLYGVNFFVFVTVLFVILVLKRNLPPYDVSYEPELLQKETDDSESINIVYRYYLDFSPSMEGFFSSEIESSMSSVEEVLKDINTATNEKKYYLCRDEVEEIQEDALYESMENTEKLRNYYDTVIQTHGSGSVDISEDKIEETIENIDLTHIFDASYVEQSGFEKGSNSLNVIITDFNFKKNSDDDEGQKKLIHEFAEEFGDICARSNVAIYRIQSKFMGITTDEYEYETENVPKDENYIENRAFFLIVESQNENAYEEYTEKLEEKLAKLKVDCSEKYELVNRISDEQLSLSLDLDELRSNDWIEKRNFNYDNMSFKNLSENAIGLRMVQENGNANLKMHICPIEVIGSNNTERTKTGDVSIQVETKASYQGKTEMSTEMLSVVRCGTVWEENELYLHVEMEMNTDTAIELLEKNSNKYLSKKFFVLELQYFMEKPDYTLPQWALDNEDMEDKLEVYESIMEKKENAFGELSKEVRYLGSTVFYITY